MADKQLKLFFSMLSGEMFYVEEDEVKNIDKSCIPLKKKPHNCRKCFDRFHIGREVFKNYYIPCPRCLRLCGDFENMKDDVVIENAKSVAGIADKDMLGEIMKSEAKK